MDIVQKQIEDWLAENLGDESLFLVEINLKKGAGQYRVEVILDGDDGISIDQCATISRQLGEYLESEDVFDAAYNIEVSSPGLGNPLIKARQYKNNIGRKVKVEYDDSGDRKSVTGILKEINDQVLVVEKKEKKRTEEIEILFNTIVQTKVIPTFK